MINFKKNTYHHFLRRTLIRYLTHQESFSIQDNFEDVIDLKNISLEHYINIRVVLESRQTLINLK